MSLVETLRRETRGAHDAIEAAVDVERHLACLTAYRVLLARYHGFHLGFEQARDASPSAISLAGALLPATGRSGLIARDLAALGMSDDAIARLPTIALAYPDRASLLGAIYVVEGSSLGGVMLARIVETRLGLTPENGTAFLTGDGRDTSRRWRAMAAALDSAAELATAPASVASALVTFATMQEWLAPAAGRIAAE